jgi:hypothetical protein
MRLSLAAKFSATVVCIVVLSIMGSLIALRAAYELSFRTEQMVAENLQSVIAAEELEIALLDQRGFVVSYILDDGDARWLDELQRRENQFRPWLDRAFANAFSWTIIRICNRTRSRRPTCSLIANWPAR